MASSFSRRRSAKGHILRVLEKRTQEANAFKHRLFLCHKNTRSNARYAIVEYAQMGKSLRVSDERVAKEIAVEAAKSIWHYTIPASFFETKYDEKEESWLIRASYFEEILTLKIDALTGNVSHFKRGKSTTQ